jgi:hypothetical protein
MLSALFWRRVCRDYVPEITFYLLLNRHRSRFAGYYATRRSTSVNQAFGTAQS